MTFSDWACEAFKIYENYNLLTDIYPFIKDCEKTNKLGKENPNKNFKSNFNYDLFNYISILSSENSANSKNSYLVCLEHLKNYQRKNLYRPYSSLSDVDRISNVNSNFISEMLHKSHIKNFSSFNYNIAFENYNLTNPKQNLNNPVTTQFHKSQTMVSLNENSVLNNTISENILDRGQINIKNKKKANDKKPKEKSSLITTICEKPKYDLKFTSFEIDADELNAINEFSDPDPKYLQKSEYEKLDYFVNMVINRENTNNIFDPELNTNEDKQIIMEHCDRNKISNEYVEDCLMRFNNSQQKKEGKLTKLKDSDILIYDV